MPRKRAKDAPKPLFDVWLRRKLARTGLLPSDVAARVGIDEGTVSRWLNEGRMPERRQVAALSVALDVSPADILQVTDPAEFTATVKQIEGRQPDEIDVLAQEPELREFLEDLRRLSPKRRAAILMLARDPDRAQE
jgi:transcriptional regulator with XRE-family HTH domain